MVIVGLVILILLGVLGIASLLRSRNPAVAGPLMQLEAIEGWIGLVGVLWALFGLLRFLLVLKLLWLAPLTALIALLSLLVILALSLILAAPLLKSLIGANGFTRGISDLARQLAPLKAILGIVCLILAALTVLRMAF